MFFSYPDFVAVVVAIVLTAVVALGVQCSTRFTTIFVVINILVLSIVTVCGIVFGHVSNWTSVELDGVGNGFMPFGWSGVLNGAATCFWTLSGFEAISCAVEESHSPQKHIPIATLLTMLIVTALYIGTAAGMTLLIPCQLLDPGAPLPSAFAYAGLGWGRYVVAIGPLCGFTTALISTTFGFVRFSLAMAEDGLLWSWFADVSEKTSVPVFPVIVCGLMQSVIAFFCDIRDLVSYSINILFLSYLAVCVAVILLQYSDVRPTVQQDTDKSSFEKDSSLSSSVCQTSRDTGEFSAIATDDLSLSHTVSEPSTDANKWNENQNFSNNTFENDKHEQIDPTTSMAEDELTVSSASDHLLPDDKHPVVSKSLLSRCICLETFIICRTHLCIRSALALMLISMLSLAFILIYGIVPLESGLWWSIVLVVVCSCGVVLFMSIICIHRQTLQTAVLMVSFCIFYFGLFHALLFSVAKMSSSSMPLTQTTAAAETTVMNSASLNFGIVNY